MNTEQMQRKTEIVGFFQEDTMEFKDSSLWFEGHFFFLLILITFLL